MVKDFPVRVYPTSPIEITFSNSRNQTNHTIQILLEKTKTVVTINGTIMTEEVPVVKYNSINDLIFRYKRNLISIDNKFDISGHFHLIRFIGFDSVRETSWIVQNSK